MSAQVSGEGGEWMVPHTTQHLIAPAVTTTDHNIIPLLYEGIDTRVPRYPVTRDQR